MQPGQLPGADHQEDIVSKHRDSKQADRVTVADLAEKIGRPDLRPGSPARLGF